MGAKVAGLDLVSSTPDGRDWLLKALHPTDPTVSVCAIPDGTASDTVRLELTTSMTLGSGNAGVNISSPWGAQISLIPSIMPVAVYTTDGASTMPAFNIRYPQFKQTLADDDFLALMADVEALRITAQSVTVHLDANATTDQGTIVACQQVTKPQMTWPNTGTAVGYSSVPVAIYAYTPSSTGFAGGDVPGYDAIMSMPRSYQANLREGVYMPLHLSNTSQHWYSQREAVGNCDLASCAYTGTLLRIANSVGNCWPHWSCTRSYVNSGTVLNVPPVCPMLNEIVGHIAIKNIHQTSSIVIKARTCFEFKVQANSKYVPYLTPAAPHDALAVDAYYRIIRQMDDAYPASYNAKGTILSTIGKIARNVAPALEAIPGWGKPLSIAASSLGQLSSMGGKKLKERAQKKKQKKASPAQPPPTPRAKVKPK